VPRKLIRSAYDGEINISDMKCVGCGGALRMHTNRPLADGTVRRRYMCRDCGKSQTYPDAGSPEIQIPDFRTELPQRDRYVVTCAQNATEIKKSFLQNLLVYGLRR